MAMRYTLGKSSVLEFGPVLLPIDESPQTQTFVCLTLENGMESETFEGFIYPVRSTH
jgi:hypothetical protein